MSSGHRRHEGHSMRRIKSKGGRVGKMFSFRLGNGWTNECQWRTGWMGRSRLRSELKWVRWAEHTVIKTWLQPGVSDGQIRRNCFDSFLRAERKPFKTVFEFLGPRTPN